MFAFNFEKRMSKDLSFEFESITSRKNPKIIRACSFADKKYRDKEGFFTFEGEKLFLEAIASGIEICEVYFTERAEKNCSSLLSKAYSLGASLYLVTDEVYDKLTYEKASQKIFILAKKLEIPIFSKDVAACGGFVLLEGVRDPSNVGAILRTCLALGSDKIILSSDCADVFGYKTVRAAMGAVFRARLYTTDNISECINLLKKHGKVYATALRHDAISISRLEFSKSDSIVIGNEGHGVSQEVLSGCDKTVIIPMMHESESLNASVAAALFIWEKAKKTLEEYK